MELHTDKIKNQLKLKDSYWVFFDGLYMENENLKDLLKQPRDKIIHDMELLVREALDNSAVYENMMSSFGLTKLPDPEFLVMALLILGELKSEESLPLFWEVFTKGFDWNSFWLCDEHFDLLWEPLVKICKNQLAEVEKHFNDTKTNWLTRSIMGDALVQMALNFPELQEKVENIFVRQIKYYIDQCKQQSSEDRLRMGTVVWDLADLGNIENLPLVRKVFQLDLMDEDVLGNINETEKIFERNNNDSKHLLMKMMPLTDRHALYWGKIN
ncbi:MAG: hypothetical protein J7L96_09870 [Bacteroidales bacterium]|nr:hypothetical protein [Bacteroidales bacterium]